MKKKLVSLILCSVMAVSLLAGCGKTTTPATSESKPATSESTAAPSESTAASESKVVAAEPTKITVAGYLYGPVDAQKDVITPAVEKRLLEEHGLNVDIEIVYIEQANYAELINTRLAGGTAPDVFLAQGNTTLETYFDQGVIKSWDMDFFKKNAPDVYDFVMNGAAYGDLKGDVDMWIEYSMLDGEMVTIPSFKPDGSMPYKQLVYRGDWLENLNVDPEALPATVEDYVDLLYRFTNEDPDKNGANDTYGLSATGIKALFGAYGMYSGFVGGTSYWMEENGEIVNPDAHANSKEVLKIIAQMYKDGVLDPEFVTGKEAISGSYWAVSNGLVNGKYGVSALASIDHFRLKGVVSAEDAGGPVAQEYWAVNGPDSTFAYGPWPAGPEGEYGYSVGYAVAVSESAVYNADMDDEKLAVIFQVLNAFASDDELYMLAAYGIEGTHYTMNDNGTVTRNANFDNTGFNEIGLWGCRSLYGGDRTFSQTAYDLVFYNDLSIANRLSWFEKDQYDSYIKDAVSITLPSKGDLQSELNTFRDETWIKMIKGELDIEKDWDAYVADWMKLGGEQLTKEANDWYKSK